MNKCDAVSLNAEKATEAEIMDCEEPDHSLSEMFDYEPRLEFDELVCLNFSSATPLEGATFDLEDSSFLISDLTENDSLEVDDCEYLKRSGMIRVNDAVPPVVVISACKLPDRESYSTETMFKFLMAELEQYVEQDYLIVYFHYGLSNKNRPQLSWFWQTYKLLDRKFKKNLKALYVVHPTNVIKTIGILMKPIISVKFGKKIMYFNHIHELKEQVNLDDTYIPQEVIEYDRALGQSAPKAEIEKNDQKVESEASANSSKKQFGVPLELIAKNNVNYDNYVPAVVRECVKFLSQGDNLDVEGLFRRNAGRGALTEAMRRADAGEPLELDNPIVAAALLKGFYKDLPEPILTFELFDTIAAFQSVAPEERFNNAANIIIERLPFPNYMLLKYLVDFLVKVDAKKESNKMSFENLALVFGPTLSWKNGPQDPKKIANINFFIEYIFVHSNEIFIINCLE